MVPFRQLLLSNSATTCQLAVIGVLVVCLLNTVSHRSEYTPLAFFIFKLHFSTM